MSHFAYVNGRYVPHYQAQLSIDDRATQFADAAYEVTCIWNGAPVDHAAHMARLSRSLSALKITPPCAKALTVACREVVRRNRINRGTIYIQVSRGVAPRAHPFPHDARRPGVVITGKHGAGPPDAMAEQGVKAIVMPDIRWGRCDIKTVGLLGNVLARQTAAEAGAYEALLHAPDGTITEASASNVWIVTSQGAIATHPIGPEILGGVTRATVIKLARESGYAVEERPFTLVEAENAREVFLTGTTTFVMPVIQLGNRVIANGVPGSVALDLRNRYKAYMDNTTSSDSAWAVA